MAVRNLWDAPALRLKKIEGPAQDYEIGIGAKSAPTVCSEQRTSLKPKHQGGSDSKSLTEL